LTKNDKVSVEAIRKNKNNNYLKLN